MSPKLPVVSGEQAIRTLKSIGYEVVRQRGSHVRMRDRTAPQIHRPVTIPLHKELKPGILKKLIRDANLSVEEFRELYKKS